MDLKREPLIDDRKFNFQFFDNTFADIAKRSDIAGVDGNNYRSHRSFLFFYEATLLFSSSRLRCGGSKVPLLAPHYRIHFK
jgi:hypothetical protein